MRGLVIVLALLAFALPSPADIGPKPRQYASGLEPRGDMEGLNIEMTAETVDLTLVKTGEARHERLVVDAVFHMTNLGDATEIEEGFPVGPRNNMSEFRVEIDGERRDVELVNLLAGQRTKGGSFPGDERADYWYVWKVKYAAKAVSRQVVHYVVDLRAGGVVDQMMNTSYILHTGAPWKNAIGRATVTFRVEGMSADHVYSVAPTAGLRRDGDVWTWTFENLEPTHASDIRVGYWPSKTWEAEVAELRAKPDLHSRGRLVERLCEAASRQGRVAFSDPELAAVCGELTELASDAQEKDGAWTLAPTGPSGDDRHFARGGAYALMEHVRHAVLVGEANPRSEVARTMLRRWVTLGEALRAGRLSSDGRVIAIGEVIEKHYGARFDDALRRGRARLQVE